LPPPAWLLTFCEQHSVWNVPITTSLHLLHKRRYYLYWRLTIKWIVVLLDSWGFQKH
jgi:hypothetical protein